MRKEREKRTAALAELYAEADNLLAEMEKSALAGLRKETHKTSLRKEEVGGKGKKKMKKGTKIAHLHWSEDGHGVSVVRMTNPIINGRFTGHGWYDMPCKTTLSPQEYANEVGEVVFYTDSYDTSGYVYPKEVK